MPSQPGADKKPERDYAAEVEEARHKLETLGNELWDLAGNAVDDPYAIAGDLLARASEMMSHATAHLRVPGIAPRATVRASRTLH